MDLGEKRFAGTGADRQLVMLVDAKKKRYFARPRPPPEDAAKNVAVACVTLMVRLPKAWVESRRRRVFRVLGGTGCKISKIIALSSLHLYP